MVEAGYVITRILNSLFDFQYSLCSNKISTQIIKMINQQIFTYSLIIVLLEVISEIHILAHLS